MRRKPRICACTSCSSLTWKLFMDPYIYYVIKKRSRALMWTCFLSVLFSSVAQSRPTLCNPMDQASSPISSSQSLLKFMSIESMMPSNHLILFPSLSPLAFNLSQHQGLFHWVSSSAFNLLYGSPLTSIHDYYWRNHSFDYTDLCWQWDFFVFLIQCLGLSWLYFQGASVF